jgi:hypothetical protein
MPTLICFSGLGGDGITVEETPEHVLDVLSGGHGGPLSRSTSRGLTVR